MTPENPSLNSVQIDPDGAVNLEIPVSNIVIGERVRGVHKAAVKNLVDSIRVQGLLQPIGVKQTGEKFKLIWGAHRLNAFKSLGMERIPARVFPADTPDHRIQLAELEENYARQELSGKQRQEFAVKLLRLRSGNNAESGNSENFQKNWMEELANKIGAERRTVHNWWVDFLKDTGLTTKPSKATEAERQQFADWLEARRATEEAEKARKAEAEREKCWEQSVSDLQQYLDTAAREWGAERIKAVVAQWLDAGDSHEISP